MTQLSAFRPLQTESYQERLLREQKASARKPDLLDASVDAARSEWVSSYFMRQVDRSGYLPDKDFSLGDDATWKLATQGLRPEYWSALGDSVSLDHALTIRDQMAEVQASRDALASMGWSGTALRMYVGLADPVTLAAGLATGGLGAGATKAGLLAKMATGGLVAAGTNLPFDIYTASQDPERGAADALLGTLSGFAIGSLGAAAGHAMHLRAVGKAIQPLARDLEAEIVTGGVPGNSTPGGIGAMSRFEAYNSQNPLDKIEVTPKGKTRFDRPPNADMVERFIESMDLDPVVDAAEIAHLRKESTGLIGLTIQDLENEPMAPTLRPKVSGGDLDLRNVSDAESQGALRFDMVGSLGKSETKAVRVLGRMLGEDALPAKDGTMTGAAASTIKRREMNKTLNEFYGTYEPAFNEWARENGVNPLNRLKMRQEFNRYVGQEVINPGGSMTKSPAIKKAADHLATQQRTLLDLLQRYPVPGMEDVPLDPTFFHVMWNAGAVNRATARYGDGELDLFFRDALRAQSPELDDFNAARIGKAMRSAVGDLDNYTPFDIRSAFSGENREVLADILRRHGQMDEADIKNILYQITPQEDAGRPSFAKHKLQLDHGYFRTMRDGSVLRMDHMFDTDAERVFVRYADDAIGTAMMSEVYRAAGERFGGVDIKNWDALKRLVINDANANKNPKIKAEAAKLDTLYRFVRGLRQSDNEQWADTARLLTNVQNVRLGGAFGWNQIGEMGNAIGEFGVRSAIDTMPELGRLFKRLKSGALDSETLDFLENVGVLEHNRLFSQVLNRFDDSTVESAADSFLGKATTVSQRAVSVSNYASLFQPIDIATKRWSALMALNRITREAFNESKIPAAYRLAELGMNQDQWKELAPLIRKHVTTETGILGRKVKRVDWDALSAENPTAGSRFITALQRWSERAIQINDPGNYSMWMSKPLGKLMTQFRTFPIVAWTKNLQRTAGQVRAGQFDAFLRMAYSSIGAGLVYAGRQYVNSVGRQDAQEYRDKYLNSSQIIKAGFSRSGWASLLPGAIDTLYHPITGDYLFQPQRTSGLPSDFALGNPTTSMLQTVFQAMGTPSKAARRGYTTQSDIQPWARLMPWQNVIGVKNITDSLISRLPEN